MITEADISNIYMYPVYLFLETQNITELRIASDTHLSLFYFSFSLTNSPIENVRLIRLHW